MTEEQLRQEQAKLLGWKQEKANDEAVWWTLHPDGRPIYGDNEQYWPMHIIPPIDDNSLRLVRAGLTLNEQGIFGTELAKIVFKDCIELEKKVELREQDDDSLIAPNGDGWFAYIHASPHDQLQAVLKVKGLL